MTHDLINSPSSVAANLSELPAAPFSVETVDAEFDPYARFANATSLSQLIDQRLELGPMAVAEYMLLVLANPKFGYYATRDPFGSKGDFITAPEISQIFGELIGLWCAHVWGLMGSPSPVHLVEFGPGRGTLMSDALRACSQAAPNFINHAQFHMIETSKLLRNRQENALRGYRVQWHDRLETVPTGPTIIIANEFFDALPIHQLVKTQTGWCERQVCRRPEGGLKFTVATEPSPLASQLHPQVAIAGLGSIAEISPKTCAIAESIRARLAEFGGAALLIDYGHAASSTGETLQAVRNHQCHDLLVEPGTADLTAHVDFGAMGRALSDRRVKVTGPVSQGFFLQRLGINERAATLARAQQLAKQTEIAAQVNRLIGNREMGELFKVMVASSAHLPQLPGFIP